MKIVNIMEENLRIFQTIWGISMKFPGKMSYDTVILKVSKKQGFTPSLENTVLEKLMLKRHATLLTKLGKLF